MRFIGELYCMCVIKYFLFMVIITFFIVFGKTFVISGFSGKLIY